MGTRSRITIIRRCNENIYLWQPWEGYLAGVGVLICEQLQKLLAEFPIYKLIEMIESITEGYHTVDSTYMLYDIITNKVKVIFNDYSAIEYEYIIDFMEKKVMAKYGGIINTLSFYQIKRGINFTHSIYADYEPETESECDAEI